MRRLSLSLGLCAAALTAPRVFAQSVEIRANQLTAGPQRAPAIAVDGSGKTVVVWEGQTAGPATIQILMRRFSPAGGPLYSEVRVNTDTLSTPSTPRIAPLGNSGFVVVWTAATQNTGDILGRRFDADGAPVGPEFRVNTYTSFRQQRPDVAASPDSGAFVVVWESYAYADAVNADVNVQRFQFTGTPAGTESRVNTYTTGDQDGPAVSVSDVNDFVVTWRSNFGGLVATEVNAQRFAGAGTPRGLEFRVNATTTGQQGAPALGLDAGGNFVIVWQSTPSDGDTYGIVGRRYDAVGAPQGAEFRVNTYSTSAQIGPAVWRRTQDFAVVWHGVGAGDNAGIFAQHFAASGPKLGVELRQNSFTANTQGGVRVGAGPGKFLAVWTSDQQDGDTTGAYMRATCYAGDADYTGTLTVSDALYLINFLFAGGPPPSGCADADGNLTVNVSDVLYLINYLFAGGPAPV